MKTYTDSLIDTIIDQLKTAKYLLTNYEISDHYKDYSWSYKKFHIQFNKKFTSATQVVEITPLKNTITHFYFPFEWLTEDHKRDIQLIISEYNQKIDSYESEIKKSFRLERIIDIIDNHEKYTVSIYQNGVMYFDESNSNRFSVELLNQSKWNIKIYCKDTIEFNITDADVTTALSEKFIKIFASKRDSYLADMYKEQKMNIVHNFINSVEHPDQFRTSFSDKRRFIVENLLTGEKIIASSNLHGPSEYWFLAKWDNDMISPENYIRIYLNELDDDLAQRVDSIISFYISQYKNQTNG